MHSLNQVNKLVSCGRDPARSLPLWRGFLLIPLILVCFAFAPQTRAVNPPPDGGYPGFNTAEGEDALKLLIGGFGNTGIGFKSLFNNLNADWNTGVGFGSLFRSRGDANTAVGAFALINNNDGARNTAVGGAALAFNEGDADGNGSFNGAFGTAALENNDSGFSNNAVGDSALFNNVAGAQNTAVGDLALRNNDATGEGDANFNTAVGASALTRVVGGSSNTAVGAGAGPNLVQGFNNTYVGQFVGDNNGAPIDDEDLTIRIADFSVDGFGSAACYIGGIWNNPQPVGDNVVVVTLNLDNDQLGYDTAMPGVVAHLLCLIVAHLNLAAAPSPNNQPGCSMRELAKLRSWKQRSRSNRNK